MILEESNRITPASLPLSLTRSQPAAFAAANSLTESAPVSAAAPIPSPGSLGGDFGLSLEENERRLVQTALERTNGNQTQAAKLLQVTRDTLRYKMKKYGLHS
jgi:DNA-binding NtrC family response regulator